MKFAQLAMPTSPPPCRFPECGRALFDAARDLLRLSASALRGAGVLACLGLAAMPLASAQLTLVNNVVDLPVFHPTTFRFTAVVPGGPSTFDQEWFGDFGTSTPNPWLHYRLTGRFTHMGTGRQYLVPGYFDTDGGTVNSTAKVGNVWTLRFTPPLEGYWDLEALFEYGQDLNVADLVPSSLDCQNSATLCATVPVFKALARDEAGEGFLGLGILRADDTAHYLRFVSETASGSFQGPYFLKTGMGSPENLLAYTGFTGTADGTWANCEQGGSPDPSPGFVHDFSVEYSVPGGTTTRSHVTDWQSGMPDWSANGFQQRGRPIIGAIAYLAQQGLNGIYVLPMNLGGDGHDTHPFARMAQNCATPPCAARSADWEVLCYHAKRMREWGTLFDHCMRSGVMVQLVLAEQELCNMDWLTDTNPLDRVGRMRKLFLKQMVAYFGHNVALVFNLCEENRLDPAYSPPFNEFSVAELDAMAAWIQMWDVYGHPITVHDKVGTYDAIVNNPVTPGTPTGQWLRLTCIGTGGEDPAFIDEYSFQSEAARNGGATWGYVASNVKTVATVDEHGYWERAIQPILADLPPNTIVGFTDHPDARRAAVRRRILYDVLFSGASFSWYFGWLYAETDGGNDLNCDDFRSRASVYSDTRIARRLLLSHMRLDALYPADQALGGNPTLDPDFGKPEVLRMDAPATWLIYYPRVTDMGGNIVPSLGTLNTCPPGPHSSWAWKFYDPTTGVAVATGFTSACGTVDPRALLEAAGYAEPDRDLVFVLYGL